MKLTHITVTYVVYQEFIFRGILDFMQGLTGLVEMLYIAVTPKQIEVICSQNLLMKLTPCCLIVQTLLEPI